MTFPFKKEKKVIIGGVAAVAVLVGGISFLSFSTVTYSSGQVASASQSSKIAGSLKAAVGTTTGDFVATHISTPSSVKSIYMTSWVAGTDDLRDKVVNTLETTGANAVVIDVKDYSGTIVFPVTDNPTLAAYGSVSVRVSDLPQFIAMLHSKGIYVIARIAVFQDAYFVKYRPDLAVHNAAGTAAWADQKGISWIDPGARDYWNYIAMIGDESYKIGFDELNFDYIRYPSDGDLNDISYPWSKTDAKADVITSFFSFLHDHFSPEHIPISADLFGETTTAPDDMGIGQVFVNALPYFNYVAPMIYPSEYAPNFDGYKNPGLYPYQIVSYALAGAVARRNELQASTTEPLAQIRPWLQDFDLAGATYGTIQVEAEIQAASDQGINSWLIWSPSNVYANAALGTK